MLPIIKIENAKGEVLNFSTDPRYFAELDGAGPPGATINHSKIAMADGTRYNSATVNERNIVLTVTLLRDVGRARLNLYRFAAAKAYIKVYFKSDALDVSIEGYVETVEVNPWEQGQTMQVSIVCPSPFWQDLGETYQNASNVDDLFEFPFAIEAEGVELSRLDVTSSAVLVNNGQVPTGLRFEVTATLYTVNPKIYNMETGEFIGFETTLEAGDRLIINTTQGKKSVTHIRDGVKVNWINTLIPGSTWLQLDVGQSEFAYTVDDGAITLGVFHTNKYQGV